MEHTINAGLRPQSDAPVVGQRRYRLTRQRASSERLGPCEVCKTHVSDVYYQVEERFYRHSTGLLREGWTHAECNSLFGHEACLKGRRRNAYLHTSMEDETQYAVHAPDEVPEEIEALGFSSEEDYAEHVRMLARRAQTRELHHLIVADGEWCLLNPPTNSEQAKP